ncbi:MAG TPA: hypothetical protein VGJ82_04640, partial [Thermoanaerobaculia bacterium]
GDKAKGKASKASKTSGKKTGQTGAKGKASSQSKGSEAKASTKVVEKSAAKAPAVSGKGSGKAGVLRPAAGNGGARAATGDASFGNAIVAAAFKRAAKKYGNAFRRLTD